jgi:hypothetical protein
LVYAGRTDLDKFTSRIDQEGFFHAFITTYWPFSESARTFRRITSAADYQDLQLTQILDMLKISSDQDHIRKREFAGYLVEFRDSAGGIAAGPTGLKFPAFFEFLISHYTNFTEKRQDEFDLQAAHDLFVQPVLQTIARGEFLDIPIAAEIARQLDHAQGIYAEIIRQMEVMQADLSGIADEYERVNEELKTHSRSLITDFFDNVNS